MTVESAYRIVPANEASWVDIETVFGPRGDGHRCHCQRYRMAPGESWASCVVEELAFRLRVQTNAGDPGAAATAG